MFTMNVWKDARFLLILSSLLVYNVYAHPYPRSFASEQLTKPHNRYRNTGRTGRWLSFSKTNDPTTLGTNNTSDAPELENLDTYKKKSFVWSNSMFSYMFAEAGQTSPTDIAKSLSGNYYALNSDYVDMTKLCPGEIKLYANVSDGSIQIPVPSGLYDPFRLCQSVGEVKISNIALSDKTTFSTRIYSYSNTYRISPIRKALMGKMPENLIQCPGDTKHPFSSITVTPLNRYLIPILVQNLKAVGVPKDTIEDIFKDETDETSSSYSFESLWGMDSGLKCKRAVREALSYLSKDHVLSLNRRHETEGSKVVRLYQSQRHPARRTIKSTHRRDSSEGEGLATKIRNAEQSRNQHYPVHENHSPSCVLLGGSALRNESVINMKKFVVSMDLIVNLLRLPLPKLTSETFYPTNTECKFCSKTGNHGMIKILSKSSTRHFGPWGMAPKFSVSYNGIACASMQIYRFVEVRRRIDSTKAIWGLATRITNYLEENRPPSPPLDEAHPTFISYFPHLQKGLQNFRLKTSVFVARMNFQYCSHYMPPIDIVLVKKPVSFFYCRGFVEKNPYVSKLCDGEVFVRASPEAIATPTAIPSADDINSTVFGFTSEHTAFIAGGGLSSTCIFSTSKTQSEQFRRAHIKYEKDTKSLAI